MEGTGPFSDADLRRALLMVASNDRTVAPALLAELAARGYFIGELGAARLTASGRRFLEAPPSDDIRAFMIETLELRRVVPSGEEQRTATNARVVVTAAELWSNETVIRWMVIGEGGVDLGDRGTRFRRSYLEDDVGTTYQSIGSGGGGDQYVTHRYDRFAGAVPDRAGTLLFTPWDTATLTVTPDSIEPIDRIQIPLR